ncbi:MAG: Cys/Met metabolism pyridoxal-phosphate-dependent enzyme [Gammaproteobacteria bacterium]|nr:MAG: Cys/Met metabolism pyridoxal-phosphate-dependent enzyme [Gammaproteobacteria bacterium]PCJ46889.1 MAG: Cys/Met metabolism pyridoxal-phosphate-dependent enzyme [Gammaproteobacteria bacterium]
MSVPQGFDAAKILSPRRNTTEASNVEGLASEQLSHYGIDENSDYGQALKSTVIDLYNAQSDMSRLWQITNETIDSLDKKDKIAYFNAKRFLSFQIAKILDGLQNPFRKVSQSIEKSPTTQMAKGSYPLFDNIPAIFSATPVIARTATYIFACTEWVDDAFQGKEMTHQIYSRLLNPTSISLANAIVDLEAGPYTAEYMAWNFNSGMAAIDSLLANVMNYGDVLLVSRNVYGGVHQLLVDHYARKDKMNIQIEWFDGYTAEEFDIRFTDVKAQYLEQLKNNKLHIYIESPCNPHGYVLDLPGICKISHATGDHLVMLDSTLATPVLNKPLQREDKSERPDYVMHSYTKDISGTGSVTSGVVIAEGHRMFIPKGGEANGLSWEKCMFWDVYYIKGAFLDADKAYEVLIGMKTLEQRMLTKVINTLVFANFLNSHEDINVNSHAVEGNENYALREKCLTNGMPSSLFTIDMEHAHINRETFSSFFDGLEPGFSLMVSIGQCNSMVLCPALTSHSELSPQAMKEARIYPTTLRLSMGNESVKDLIAAFVNSARTHIDKVKPGFTEKFMPADEIDTLVVSVTLDIYKKLLATQPKMSDLLIK